MQSIRQPVIPIIHHFLEEELITCSLHVSTHGGEPPIPDVRQFPGGGIEDPVSVLLQIGEQFRVGVHLTKLIACLVRAVMKRVDRDDGVLEWCRIRLTVVNDTQEIAGIVIKYHFRQLVGECFDEVVLDNVM